MVERWQESVSKILSANDLGLTGSHQAGLHIPKDPQILGFFPHLDPSVVNPDCQISVHAENSDAAFLLRFIYYNGKKHQVSTRDEYRLTGTTKLFRELGACPGDSLVFTRSTDDDFEVSLLRAEPAQEEKEIKTFASGWRIA